MELIDRYIYDVTRRLPEKQREDIAKELSGLIEDMLAQRAGDENSNNADIEAVLTELGEPSALAAKYSGRPRYLIGPELFDTYTMVVKIAVAAAAFGMLVALTVGYAVTPPDNIGEVFGNIIASIFSAAIQGFALVTLVFALIEHFAVDLKNAKWKKEKWHPSDLPEIPVKGEKIRRSEPIVGIIFIILFFVILNFNPGLLSIFKKGFSPIPVFDISVLMVYMSIINISFAVSIIKEIMKLVFGRYNIRFAAISLILSSISLILTVIVFSNFHIWNWNFVSGLQQVYGFSLPAHYDAMQTYTIFAKVFLGVIIFAYVVESITTVIKTIRYNVPGIKRFLNRVR
jgi:hypothetical protein